MYQYIAGRMRMISASVMVRTRGVLIQNVMHYGQSHLLKPIIFWKGFVIKTFLKDGEPSYMLQGFSYFNS